MNEDKFVEAMDVKDKVLMIIGQLVNTAEDEVDEINIDADKLTEEVSKKLIETANDKKKLKEEIVHWL